MKYWLKATMFILLCLIPFKFNHFSALPIFWHWHKLSYWRLSSFHLFQGWDWNAKNLSMLLSVGDDSQFSSFTMTAQKRDIKGNTPEKGKHKVWYMTFVQLTVPAHLPSTLPWLIKWMPCPCERKLTFMVWFNVLFSYSKVKMSYNGTYLEAGYYIQSTPSPC